MLETIIETGSEIVRRSEHIIENARRLVFSGCLEDSEALAVYREADRLMEAMFAMSDAVGRLGISFERRSEVPRSLTKAATIRARVVPQCSSAVFDPTNP